MMSHFVFIMLLTVHFAYEICSCMASGRNCTASDRSACIFQCIEKLYDKRFCNVCSLHKNPIKLNESEILASLIPYHFVRYDDTLKSIISLPSCSGCVTEKSLEHIFIEYVQPNELHQFFGLTVLSHHIKINHTIAQGVDEYSYT